jgi:hypothetical protein
MIEQPNNPNSFNDPNNPNNPINQNNSNFQNITQNVEKEQANDPELYPTMKKVIEESEKKYHPDQRKEDVDNIGESESLIKSGSMKRKLDFNKLEEGFKDIFNKGNSNINDVRRDLIHLIIVLVVINCIAWEIDCLFLDACYGENIEMELWISHTLCPLIFVSLVFLYLIFEAINYLKQIPIRISVIIYAIISVFFIVLGIISIYQGLDYKEEKAQKRLYSLTRFEREYYKYLDTGKSDEENLKRLYKLKMLFTGILDLVLGVLGIILIIFCLIFNSLLSQTTFDWRPPLRSHVNTSRIKKAIELVQQNNESFINIFRAENPHYQIDEIDNKDVNNRLGGLKGSFGESLDLSKEKKDLSNSGINNVKINNNNDEELVLPKATTKKNKDNDANKGYKNEPNQENQQQQDHVENHVNPENEINTKMKDDNIIDNK